MIAYIRTNPSMTKVKEMVMVTKITPTVASEDLRQEETVIIVAQTTLQRSAQHMVKLVIHAMKWDISSCIADPDNKAKAKVENGGLTQTKGNPGMIIMKLQQTTETKMMTPAGSNMNRTLCKYYLVKVSVLTLTLK